MGRYDIKDSYKSLVIDGWSLQFIFVDKVYPTEEILDTLYLMGSPMKIMSRVYKLVTSNEYDTGFTVTNKLKQKALVVIGPSSSSGEFINTFVHELYHLATQIVSTINTGDEELSATLAGDCAQEFACEIYKVGCSRFIS